MYNLKYLNEIQLYDFIINYSKLVNQDGCYSYDVFE